VVKNAWSLTPRPLYDFMTNDYLGTVLSSKYDISIHPYLITEGDFWSWIKYFILNDGDDNDSRY